MAADGRDGQRGAGAIEFRVAARLENLSLLRTVVVAVGTYSDLNFDAVADLRLAVDEACTRLIEAAVPNATLVVVVDPGADAVVVEASTECECADVLTEDSFSWHVLSSLTDDVRIVPDGRVFGIALTTRRGAST